MVMTARKKLRVNSCLRVAAESRAVKMVASVLEYFFNTVSAYLRHLSVGMQTYRLSYHVALIFSRGCNTLFASAHQCSMYKNEVLCRPLES